MSDTGRGIDPRLLPHVFDPFRQEERSHTHSRAGLGLGLAITQQLVEMHGGQIHAHSEGEGRGASFVVTLPALAARTGATPNKPLVEQIPSELTLESPNELRGLYVLVVDDDEDARYLISEIFDCAGARVLTVSNVQRALEVLARDCPDLALSDIGMPEQDVTTSFGAFAHYPTDEASVSR